MKVAAELLELSREVHHVGVSGFAGPPAVALSFTETTRGDLMSPANGFIQPNRGDKFEIVFRLSIAMNSSALGPSGVGHDNER